VAIVSFLLLFVAAGAAVCAAAKRVADDVCCGPETGGRNLRRIGGGSEIWVDELATSGLSDEAEDRDLNRLD
jgi:hypothetical protein